MILYFSYAGRIKQRILCCRKFIIMFGSSDLFIEQLLALAECRLLKFSFRAWQKYCILSLLSLDRFSEGILINISSKKNAFVRVFTLTILWLSAILKLDFLKSPGKSGSARPPRGMKLGNSGICYGNWFRDLKAIALPARFLVQQNCKTIFKIIPQWTTDASDTTCKVCRVGHIYILF